MSGIYVYDSLSRRETEFVPQREGHVGIYVCGMTVQDKPHVGHFLPFLTADIIRRYLEFKGFEVTHVQNFTDIDDKIIARAEKENLTAAEVANRNIQKCLEAITQMNLLPATHYPKATEHMDEIIALITTLIEKDFAYASPHGDVYYRVRKFADYGVLSGRKIDDLMSGARIEVGEEKDDPLDFTLWKAAKPGEPQWESPWGAGRPGWHIECSAMSMKYLGETLDMHGGGRDLLFPHHENELAQSEAATGKKFVRYWMQNGLLYTSGQKMSKSLGNFFLIEDLLQQYTSDELRFFLLSTHFRSQAEYSPERLDESKSAFARIREGLLRLAEAKQTSNDAHGVVSEAGQDLRESVSRARTEFFELMDHDFNAAGAMGKVFEMTRATNRFIDGMTAGRDNEILLEVEGVLHQLLQLLGFFSQGWPVAKKHSVTVSDAIEQLARDRVQARSDLDWERADQLRDELLSLGYVVEDRPGGYRLKAK